MTSGWHAGAARVRFPVPVGTKMAGYAARTGPSTGTLDELTIGALVLGSGQDRFVLVAADLAAVDSALVDEIATGAGLARSELVLCASHTHSGPAGVITRMHPGDTDQRNPALRETFVQQCLAAIAMARQNAEPVELLFGQAETSGLAANRNGFDKPYDPRVSVLATRNALGRFTSMLVHFACHPTILSAANRMISPDFPGALRSELEQNPDWMGTPPLVLFANGAAGDISTRFTRESQDMTEVERVGQGLAAFALRALATAQPLDPAIETAAVTVTLAPRALGSPVDGTDAPGAPAVDSTAEQRKAETRAQGAMLLDRLNAAGPDSILRTIELPAWRLGELALVAIPGELFASLGSRISASVPGPSLVLGYANGYAGYLVDEDAHSASTYEALASPFTPDAGEIVVRGAREALARVHAPSTPTQRA